MKENSNRSFQFTKPQAAAEPVELAQLLDEISAVIRLHVVLSAHAATALALWVVHTYVFDERDAVAYVSIESPEKRCGKTTLLSVLAGLACRALVASNITVSALFRVIDDAGPTLLIDEADTFLGGNSVMRGILNCGNTWRTAYVLRLSGRKGRGPKANQDVSKNDEALDSSLVRYSCWCPKVIAMIGRVPDTIADRSVVIRLERKLVTEKCAPLTDFKPETITAKCVRFADDNSERIASAALETVSGLNDRAADTFEPLFVLARMLQDIYRSADAATARQRFKVWCRWVRWAARFYKFGLFDPMRTLAKMVTNHLAGILAHWKWGITNAFMEGLNSVFSATKRKARGYRSSTHLITMLYFVAGKLRLPQT